MQNGPIAMLRREHPERRPQEQLSKGYPLAAPARVTFLACERAKWCIQSPPRVACWSLPLDFKNCASRKGKKVKKTQPCFRALVFSFLFCYPFSLLLVFFGFRFLTAFFFLFLVFSRLVKRKIIETYQMGSIC